MGIMAKRFTRWSVDLGILSEEQKSARPTEGCHEHTYILKAAVGQARRNKKKLSHDNINRWADDENPLCRVCNTGHLWGRFLVKLRYRSFRFLAWSFRVLLSCRL